MQEHLLDRDAQHGERQAALQFAERQQVRVVVDHRPAVHAQGLAHRGDHEDHPHMVVLQDIPKPVDPGIAGPVGDQQVFVVLHRHKTRPIALGRDVDPGAVGGGEQQEWALGDEGAGVPVEPGDLLGD